MQELADRPLRVPGEPWPVHLWRLARWGANLRLVPSRPEWRPGRWRALRTPRLADALTRPGQVLVWSALMIALLGFRNRSGFPLLGAGVALGAVVWAGVVGRLLRPRLKVDWQVRGPALLGSAHRARVRLINVGRWPAFDLSARPLRQAVLRRDAEPERAVRTRLGAGAATTLDITLIPRRRGVLALDGVAVHSYFPFHLTRTTTRVAQARELCVLPPAPPLDLPPLRTLAADLAGRGAQRAQRDAGVEYQESRPFRPGDSPLRLDHRASARRGEPYTRVYQGSERYVPAGLALVVEPSVAGFARWQRRPRNPAALDRRIGAAAEVVRRAAAEQLAVRWLWLGGQWLTPDDTDAVWNALARMVPAHAPTLPTGDFPAECLGALITGDAHAAAQAWRAQHARAGAVIAWLAVAEGRRSPAPALAAGIYACPA